jgi:CheY-like chemotaxis protein
MSYLAVCVTSNQLVRRVLRRTLFAAGSQVDFVDDCADVLAREGPPPDLIVVDDASKRTGLDLLIAQLGSATKVVLLGDAVTSDTVVELLRHDGCDHLIGQDEQVDEDELVITSAKLLRGRDLFGLEKYLTWGVPIRDLSIASYDEKRAAIRDVTDYAREVGCRRQLVARIETVTDELLMNALYDAPAQRFGCRPLFQGKGRPGAGPVTDECATLRFACDGKNFALAVRDNFGELRKSNILDHLARAKAEKGLPKLTGEEGGGGGLGLYFILSSVTRFVANIQPGKATEVICLFDLRSGTRDFHYRAKSLSIFVEAVAGAAA